jgi:prevent-host-death family protein
LEGTFDMRISLTETRNNLARLVHLAEDKDEVIVITRRGVAVARIRRIRKKPAVEFNPFADLGGLDLEEL